MCDVVERYLPGRLERWLLMIVDLSGCNTPTCVSCLVFVGNIQCIMCNWCRYQNEMS